MNRVAYFLVALFILFSLDVTAQSNWTKKKLKQRSIHNQDSSKWNQDLLKRDIENQQKDLFAGLPITRSAFPVADYDYYLTTNPFTISAGNYAASGISVGENTSTEKKVYHFSIFILADTGTLKNSGDLALSRNYPYFTAEGFFEFTKVRYDWLTVKSPDGFSMAIVNMKLFDLRFGKTVFIVPQTDGSFNYLQLETSPTDYNDFEQFKAGVMKDQRVINLINFRK